MREWNAEAYHRVSDPQLAWGLRVLLRLPLRGDECVLDVGCGTGRLTDKLLERLPAGQVVALDQSLNMLAVARDYLAPRFPSQVRLVAADAAALPVANRADAVFSTATFHWVLDHPALFRSLFAALKPGGRLVAQCGGGPNIQRVRDRCAALSNSQARAHFAGGVSPGNSPLRVTAGGWRRRDYRSDASLRGSVILPAQQPIGVAQSLPPPPRALRRRPCATGS